MTVQIVPQWKLVGESTTPAEGKNQVRVHFMFVCVSLHVDFLKNLNS